MLLDLHQRRIAYLRLSLTEACAMRCTYCRPERHGQPVGRELLKGCCGTRVAGAESAKPRPMAAAVSGASPTQPQPPRPSSSVLQQLLSAHEIERLVGHLASRHGLRKVRLTGGEPTSRPDLTRIIRGVAAVPGIADLAMTTNGLTLAHRAGAYADAGLRRVNVSLDTLDAGRFARITGVDGLERVLAGLDAAESAGLTPIRLNAVVVRGENDGDLPDLVRFAARRGWDIRFIELMPMGPLAAQWAERYVPEAVMRRRLDPVVRRWQPLEQGHDAARRYRVLLDDGRTATVGFITPMSCNFCAACNRIRLASNGTLYPCLMDEPGPNLLPALRPRFDPSELDRLLTEGLSGKHAEHPAQGPTIMVQLGG